MPKTGKNRVVFLLGAGISNAVGMPCTDQITRDILRGENVVRNGNEKYIAGDPDEDRSWLCDRSPEIVKCFLKVVRNFFIYSALYKASQLFLYIINKAERDIA